MRLKKLFGCSIKSLFTILLCSATLVLSLVFTPYLPIFVCGEICRGAQHRKQTLPLFYVIFFGWGGASKGGSSGKELSGEGGGEKR